MFNDWTEGYRETFPETEDEYRGCWYCEAREATPWSPAEPAGWRTPVYDIGGPENGPAIVGGEYIGPTKMDVDMMYLWPEFCSEEPYTFDVPWMSDQFWKDLGINIAFVAWINDDSPNPVMPDILADNLVMRRLEAGQA